MEFLDMMMGEVKVALWVLDTVGTGDKVAHMVSQSSGHLYLQHYKNEEK